MRRSRKAFWICCLVLCLLLQSVLLSGVMVHAAPGASIAFSSNTVKIGDTVTVTVSFSGGGTAMGTVEAEVTYDTSVLTFVSGDNANEYASGKISLVGFTTSTSGVKEFAFPLTFKAKAAGSAVVSASTIEFVTLDGDAVSNISKNASVTVRAISKDATLKALSLDNGTLSPKFAAGTLEYTASVANTVSAVTVSATATDSNAKVTGTGKVNLSVGKNTINVKVTAEDGTTVKTYTITVTRAAATPKPTVKPTPTPTKAPTKEPTEAPTNVPTEVPTEAPTDVPTEVPTEGSTETPVATTPGTEIPSQSATNEVTTMPEETPDASPVQTQIPTNTQGGLMRFPGLFTVQTAFAFCAIGMFFVGGTVGFILCYVVKSKKRKNDRDDEN